MCTVTLVPFSDSNDAAIRIADNRDESPARPAALPPQLRRFGQRSAILPIDPISDGTWIAVNDAGLGMVLLNRNPVPGTKVKDPTMPSRGTIIPLLLHCDHVQQAERLACELAEKRFAPFRLLVLDRHKIVEISAALQQWQASEHPWQGVPLMFTSSGLGDQVVSGPRRELFEGWFSDKEKYVLQQDAFHRHSWPDRRHLSVCMRRDGARTISYTVIELCASAATMTYFPQPPDEAGSSFSSGLQLVP